MESGVLGIDFFVQQPGVLSILSKKILIVCLEVAKMIKGFLFYPMENSVFLTLSNRLR